jgi:proteasome accessory factor C
VRERHDGKPDVPAHEVARPPGVATVERPAGPVAPERFAVLQSLLAYLLAACGDGKEADIPVGELLQRFPSIPPEELEEHLSLLNLVNFGGGCYTVYAELRDEVVHVDKELWGDTFRSAPRLTPLEARAIRLALEYVGPMIAADSHTPLERVRNKLEETFGQFDLAQTPEPQVEGEEEDIISKLARGIREHRLAEIEYQKETDPAPATRTIEPYQLERRLPNWYVHAWDRGSDSEKSFRIDRMRTVKLTREKFEPRSQFEPTRLRDAEIARVLYSPEIARFEVERGAQPLADGSAINDVSAGSDAWLESDILSKRGEAVVLEPLDVRSRIAARAKELAKELGVERMRVKV